MSDKKLKLEIIIIHETVWQSLASDAGSFGFLTATIGLGKYFDSSAMQWAGFLLFALMLFGKFAMKRKRRLSSQEAADYIRDHWGVTATPKKQ